MAKKGDKTMNKLLFAVCMTITAGVFAATPNIDRNSVTMSQDPLTREVKISYTLSGAPGIVTVDILTNGVSIGAEHFRNISGDVNRKVETGNREIRWNRPYDAWKDHGGREFTATAVVTAWATNSPPTYMVIDTETLSPVDFRFYPNAESIPGSVTNDMYKTRYLAMRRVYATGVLWRMGTPAGEADRQKTLDKPHLVILTNDYYLGVYELTQKQWQNIYNGSGASGLNATPSVYKTAANADILPVENMKWKELRGDGDSNSTGYNWPRDGHNVNSSYFFGKLRSKTKLLFDLPTGAQWEFACRAGCTLSNNVYGAKLDDIAWHTNNSAVAGVVQTHPVGLKKPNAWGFYDMLGNVEEWCLDRYTDPIEHNADGTPRIEPQGANATSGNRLRRGGSFIAPSYQSCCGRNLYGWSQNANNAKLGLRLWCPAVVP